ncbi:hypothetical protein D9M71_186780 [compost metagenome]
MPGIELTAGLAQYPVAGFDHQAELFENRYEITRRNQPATRVTPAQQRLGAGQALAVATELRLVIEHELFLLQGMAQVAFKFQAFQSTGVHISLIELEVVFAAFFSVVHRRIGVFHQLAQLIAVLRAQGDADTGSDEEFAVLQHEGLDQAGQDQLGYMDGTVQGHFAGCARLQQQGELIAPHAGHGVVVMHTIEQACGHVLEHAIAGGVAERIVDRLEAIKVQEHQHHPGFLPLGLLQCRMQAILEQCAVGQVSEGVIVGQAMNALFAGLALADVAEEAHVTGQVAFVVNHCSNANPCGVVLTAAPLEPDFAFPGAALVQLLEHIAQVRLLLVIDGEHVWQLVEHLADGVSADPAEGFVGLYDIAGGVGDQNGRGRMFEYRGGHAQVFFRAALLADVSAHAEDALEYPVLVPNQYQPQLDGDLATIGTQAIEQEQLGGNLLAQHGQLFALAQGTADPIEQRVDASQLRRVGDGALPAVVQDPVDVIAQYCLYRRADVVELQGIVGGENHVADAFGEHAVALFAVTQ